MTEPEYSDEEVAEFIDEFVKEVSTGVYDKHLRAIARSAFKRRDALTGDASVVLNHVPPEGRVLSKEGDGTTNCPAPPEIDLLVPDSVDVIPFRTRVNPNDVIRWNGKRYYRKDFVGKHIRFPSNAIPKALRGCLLEVTGVGDSKVKILIKTSPNSDRGRFMDNYRNKEPMFLSRNWFFNIYTIKKIP